MRGSGWISGDRVYFLSSESFPVRHKPNLRNPNLRISKESWLSRNNWIEVWNANSGCVTFFFKNFPVFFSTETLFKKFKEIESVRDVFIPRKKYWYGQRYEFIRFGGNVNLEIELNNIWIESYKIRVNISKFARHSANQKVLRVEQDRPIKILTRHGLQKVVVRRENISYAEVVSRDMNAQELVKKI